MDDRPSDRVNEILRRYQQGSPTSKKRERMASPETASAKKSLRDEESRTGKFLMRAARPASVHQDRFPLKTAVLASVFHEPTPSTKKTPEKLRRSSRLDSNLIKQFEQRPESIQPGYKATLASSENERNIGSELSYNKGFKTQERSYVPMVTQDDVAISRRKIHTSFDIGHVAHKDDKDGSDSAEDNFPSYRATSPSSRSSSPEARSASPSSDRSPSPPTEKTSVQPIERSLSPETRPLSPMENLSKSPEESSNTKRSASYDEVEDSLAALDALAEDIGKDVSVEQKEEDEKPELKERSRSASSLEATDLDFSVIESSSQLDVGVSKDRAILRQKGSLAKRRKPTRSSMRSRGNEEDMFAVDIPVDNDQEDNRNEHDDEAKEPVHEKEEVKKAPMRNSFLLPGLGEQPKLRSKPRVPLPNITTPVTATVSMTTNESNPPETSTPGWMVEARLRRQSRTPTEETTNLTRDPEAGKPEWMREALAKKRRSMDMQQRKEWRVKEDETKNISAPWVKERPLKHIEQEPVDQTMTIDNKNSSRSSPDIGGATIFVSSSRLDSSPNFDTPSKYAVDRKLDSLSISKSEKDMLNEKDIKNGNNKWLSDSPRSRDLLTPIKDNSVDMNLNPVETQDENTPPRKNSTTGSDYQTSAVISSLEQSGSSSILRNKSKLPPLNKTSSSTNNNVETVEAEDSVPSWKAEIQLRRRSKVFTQIKKPDQPIRLGETPQWKLDLAERTKTKKDDVDVPKPKTDILTQTTTPQPSTTPSTVPPWQRELADRKKRNSLNPKALEPLEKTSAKEEPEWAGLAEKRRSRLANSGLVKT